VDSRNTGLTVSAKPEDMTEDKDLKSDPTTTEITSPAKLENEEKPILQELRVAGEPTRWLFRL
jgi:hypothetical protein